MGAGVGSFGTLFPIYRVPGYYLATMHPHSDPLNILVETGILGLLAWLTVWAVFFRETGQTRQGPRIWLPDALRAGMGAMLIAGLGQCYVADEEVAQVWLFLATAALVLVRHLKTDAARAAPPAQGKVA
jgi:O-antigen ligase